MLYICFDISFPLIEKMNFQISITKFSDLFPAFTSASAIGSVLSIWLCIDILILSSFVDLFGGTPSTKVGDFDVNVFQHYHHWHQYLYSHWKYSTFKSINKNFSSLKKFIHAFSVNAIHFVIVLSAKIIKIICFIF